MIFDALLAIRPRRNSATTNESGTVSLLPPLVGEGWDGGSLANVARRNTIDPISPPLQGAHSLASESGSALLQALALSLKNSTPENQVTP